MTVGLALEVSDGLDAEREASDIVRVIRLSKADTVMSYLGDRFQDACVLVNDSPRGAACIVSTDTTSVFGQGFRAIPEGSTARSLPAVRCGSWI